MGQKYARPDEEIQANTTENFMHIPPSQETLHFDYESRNEDVFGPAHRTKKINRSFILDNSSEKLSNKEFSTSTSSNSNAKSLQSLNTSTEGRNSPYRLSYLRIPTELSKKLMNTYLMPNKNHSKSIDKDAKSTEDVSLNQIESGESKHNFDYYEREIISKTFKFIKDDLNNVGVIAFMKSFETQPDIKDNFQTMKELPLDELSKSHALRTHSSKVMRVVEEFVNALEENDLQVITSKLFELGERHNIYGSKKSFFLVIEYQFINAIKPIVIKNLQQAKQIKLVESINGNSLIFEKERSSNRNDDDESYLNDEQIEKAMIIIESKWHKVFEVIRFHMDRGVDFCANKIGHKK